MKHLLLTTIVAVLLVGCTATQHSADVKPSKPVVVVPSPQAEANTEADNALIDAAQRGSIESVKQYLDAGADMNVKDDSGWTPLHWAASKVHNKIAKLLIEKGADVNAVNKDGLAPLDYAENETFGVLIDHGAKTGEELKAEGK